MTQDAVLVSSHCTPGYPPALLTGPNHRRYAARFGFGQQMLVATPVPGRFVSWGKVAAAAAGLAAGAGVVFHVDADAVFAAPADLRAVLPADGDLVVSAPEPGPALAADPRPISCGTFAVRNTCWARDFLGRWWESAPDPAHPWGEQLAFQELFRADPEVRARTRVLPTRAINGCPLVPGHYEPGDLVAHPAGLGGDPFAKLRLLADYDARAGF
jgi:hypothetical protein